MPPEIPRLSPEATRELERALRSRVAGDVDFGAAARALYAADASNYRQPPIGVVFPAAPDDIVETVRICRAYGVPILPRGAGTSLAGQCCNVAVVIDTSRHMRAVLDIDTDRKTARVQPGLVLDDLQHAVKGYGLMFGPDPATHAWCTLGGMIGNNSCGVHSVVGGLTADVVAELDVLTSDGTRLTVGPTSATELDAVTRDTGRRGEIYRSLRTLRDEHADEIRARYPTIPRRVSGYNLDALLPEHGFDLARALVGSEGTCVTVLEATVRLMDRPRATALLVLGFRDVYAAADQVMDVLEGRPIGLEAIDEVLVGNLRRKEKLPRELQLLPEGEAWLLVEFGADTADDAAAAARRVHRRLGPARRSLGGGGRHPAVRSGHVFTSQPEIEMVWRIRESGLGATAFVPGEQETWEGWEDAAVPPERLGAYLRDFRNLLGRYDYRGSLYGHFGQGCVHTRTNFDLKTPDGIAKFRSFIDEAADLVVAYGGSLSGEHGDGQARAVLLPKMFGHTLTGVFRAFKRIWDPDGLMNPGKIVDAYTPTDNLRRPGYSPEPVRAFFPLTQQGGIAGAALRCVGVGKCRKTDEGTMCPSYMVTHDEQHSTRGRAHLLFEMLRGETITSGWASDEVKHALDLCLACKACKSECPVSVDMATYKAEFLAQHYEHRSRPARAYLFGHIDWWAALASRVPRLVNAAASLPLARRLQALAGIAPQRTLPRFARQSFQHWMQRHPPHAEGRKVVLWSDTFTNYFHPEVGRAGVAVLEHLGYRVIVPPQTCCGRPLYDFGLLESARDYLDAVVDALAEPLADGTPIVVLEPSCFAVFRDEAPNLRGDRIARALAERVVLFDSFIRPHVERGELSPLSGEALVQVHCHQQALAGREETAAALKASRLNARILDAGCCGMAGAFGYDAAHYGVSVAVGERILLPEVRKSAANTEIIADGFSCREQIQQLTGRKASHLSEVLARALGEMK